MQTNKSSWAKKEKQYPQEALTKFLQEEPIKVLVSDYYPCLSLDGDIWFSSSFFIVNLSRIIFKRIFLSPKTNIINQVLSEKVLVPLNYTTMKSWQVVNEWWFVNPMSFI